MQTSHFFIKLYHHNILLTPSIATTPSSLTQSKQCRKKRLKILYTQKSWPTFMIMIIIILRITLIITITITERITTLGRILILRALISTLTIRYIIGSWFAFILFLIYITGILVLFRYILAIRPNNFYSKINNIKKLITCTTALLATTIITNPIVKLAPLTINNNFEKAVTQLYSKTRLSIYWFIAIILLIALIITVSLCYKSPKPLRLFIN